MPVRTQDAPDAQAPVREQASRELAPYAIPAESVSGCAVRSPHSGGTRHRRVQLLADPTGSVPYPLAIRTIPEAAEVARVPVPAARRAIRAAVGGRNRAHQTGRERERLVDSRYLEVRYEKFCDSPRQ